MLLASATIITLAATSTGIRLSARGNDSGSGLTHHIEGVVGLSPRPNRAQSAVQHVLSGSLRGTASEHAGAQVRR